MKQILALMQQGKSNQEITAMVGTTPASVASVRSRSGEVATI